MQLPGRLRLTTLGDLLGALHRACASGTLELVEVEGARAGRSHRVFFDAGLIQDVDTSLSHPRLGEILARDGLLSMSALACVARRLLEQPGKRVGEILVEEGLGTADLVAGALRRQRSSRLEALYGLREALIRFRVPRRSPRRKRARSRRCAPRGSSRARAFGERVARRGAARISEVGRRAAPGSLSERVGLRESAAAVTLRAVERGVSPAHGLSQRSSATGSSNSDFSSTSGSLASSSSCRCMPPSTPTLCAPAALAHRMSCAPSPTITSSLGVSPSFSAM